MNLVFESDRLEFRPLEEGDLDLAIVQWTDPDVIKYVGERTYSIQEITDEMPIVTRRAGGGCIGIWCLTDKTSNEKIGSAILLPMPVELDDTDWDLLKGDDIPDAEIEVGYILKKSAWGRGYATEACTRMLRFAFEDTPLTEVVATIDADNSASRHVLLKSGMIETGMIHAYAELAPGFKLTKKQWLAANHG